MDISVEIKNTKLVTNNINVKLDFNSDPATWLSFLTSKQIYCIVITSLKTLTEFLSFQLNHKNRHFSKTYFYRHILNGKKLVRFWLIYSKSTERIFVPVII